MVTCFPSIMQWVLARWQSWAHSEQCLIQSSSDILKGIRKGIQRQVFVVGCVVFVAFENESRLLFFNEIPCDFRFKFLQFSATLWDENTLKSRWKTDLFKASQPMGSFFCFAQFLILMSLKDHLGNRVWNFNTFSAKCESRK